MRPIVQQGWIRALAFALIGAASVMAVGLVHGQSSPKLNNSIATLVPDAPAGYAGSAACAQCHAAETSAWADSQHSQAMQPATPVSVLGNF